MGKDWLVIAVTSPLFFPDEAAIINKLLKERKVDFVHLRKPDSLPRELEKLILGIDSDFHSRLKLHDHFDLLEKYDIGGVHLNSRNKLPHPLANSISRSIHSLNELKNSLDFDYSFLSPIFDSISKPGYSSAFNFESLAKQIKDKRIIALGGVSPEKFPVLERLGFYGAAMLGHFFKH